MYKPLLQSLLQYLLFSSFSCIYSTNLNLKTLETNKQKHVFYSKYCKVSSQTLRVGKDLKTEILKKI